MATSINLGYCLWLDGSTVNALLGRQNHVAASFYNTGAGGLQVRSGVLPGSGQMVVSPGTGMQVAVAAGACVVANSSGSTYGGYLFSMISSGTLTVATADPTNPRIDLVCATVSDVGTSSSFAEVQIITGTPAGVPVAPSLPSNSLSLATVLVPASASSILSANVTLTAAQTVAAGGILPVSSPSAAPAGYNGAYLHDLTSGSLKHNSAAGLVQAQVLPYKAISNLVLANVSIPASPGSVTVASISFNSDGSTDWEIQISAAEQTSSNTLISNTIFLDSTLLQAVAMYGPTGLCHTVYTSPLISTRPSAGSHTFSWLAQTQGGGPATSIQASNIQPALLRIIPVTQ